MKEHIKMDFYLVFCWKIMKIMNLGQNLIFQGDELTKCFPFSTEPKFLKILTKWKVPMISALFRKLTDKRFRALYIYEKNTGNFGGSKSGISDW